MPEYTYLIIGGGMTADAAAQGIRQQDTDGTIGIISSEPDPPYNRPPLSKDLWKGMEEKLIWRDINSKEVDLHLGVTAAALDPDRSTVTDTSGTEYHYQKLLLATGGTPIQIPNSPDGIIYYRTHQDYQRLRELAETKTRYAVVGGGFIGSEIAAALASNGKEVTMIFPETGIGGGIFPPNVSDFLTSYYQEKNVTVMTEELVKRITLSGKDYQISLESGKQVKAEVVVAGLGITPNTSLAEDADLLIADGIQVDEYLQTSHANIYAAGDVANFYNPALGKHVRVEHEENANLQGMTAGVNMAGGSQKYETLPSFYSDLFDLGYEAVGETDPAMEIVQDWRTEPREGIIYYLQDERVRGVVLWGIWQQVDNARSLIAEKAVFKAENLQGRLPA
ncbi:MAG: FAD/NAD(P)-binding oxidoreductase [Calditrichota bacterium]